jgi:hypothetical protein
MRSAGCSHYYCHECWRGFIRAAAGGGPRCLLMRCSDPAGCSVPVVRELVDAAAAGKDRLWYTLQHNPPYKAFRCWRNRQMPALLRSCGVFL